MRANQGLLVGLWAVVLAAGCVGTTHPLRSPDTRWATEPAYRTNVSGAVPSEAPMSSPPGSDVPASATTEPATPAAADGPVARSYKSEATASEPAPRERPGLGTEWGETRPSHVEDVTFFRSNPGRPFAVAQLFYNDRAGVDALAGYHGVGDPRSLDVSIANGTVTTYLVDKDWGMPLDAMRVGARTYVVGQEGHRYSILIANRTPRRFEAVATVDGLDVISGRTGSYENRGYLLGPWSTVEIDGFRQGEDAVAAFRFSKVDESYAAQRGEARNVGVIGVAFFAERGDDWSTDELRMRDTARPFPRERRFAQPPW